MTDESPTLGMKISQAEFDLVSDILMGMAAQAASANRRDIEQILQRFVVRMRHHVFAGTGIDQATFDRHTSDAGAALAKADYEGARASIVALLAAAMRMDPDPAGYVALELAPVLVHMTVQSAILQQRRLEAESLLAFARSLASERAMFEADKWKDKNGKPISAADVFDYVKQLLEFSATELKAGRDPYAQGDTDASH